MTVGGAHAEQPRDDRGRWAPGGNGSAEAAAVSLAEADGSFYWPPPFRNAEQLVNFFETVKIPDEALTRLSRAYAARREAEVQSYIQEYFGQRMGDWDQQNPAPKPGWTNSRSDEIAEHRERRETAGEALAERLRTEAVGHRMMTIPVLETRTCARALRISRFVDSIPEDQRDIALDMPISSSGSTGSTTTRRTMDRFDLEPLWPVVEDEHHDDFTAADRDLLEEIIRGQETLSIDVANVQTWVHNVRRKADYLISGDLDDLQK